MDILLKYAKLTSEDPSGKCSQVIRKHFTIPFVDVVKCLRNWSYNRPPDVVRIEEICSDLNKGIFPPKTLCVAEIEPGWLDIYDGMHRFSALKESYIQNKLPAGYSINLDCLCGPISSDDVAVHFLNINKSVSVPLLYKDILPRRNPDAVLIRDFVSKLVNHYAKMYPAFCSANTNCNRPNFHPGSFIEDLYDLYIGLDKEYDVSFAEFEALLEALGSEYALDSSPPVIPKTVVKKCKQYHFYLTSRLLRGVYVPRNDAIRVLNKMRRPNPNYLDSGSLI